MTPLMQQYQGIKQNYPDALLLFQVGDFFELFYDDAVVAASFLGITLTKRGISEGVPIPLCGVPCHTIDHYLIKLVHGGFRVVMCEQQGEAVAGKLVERTVRRVFSPGTVTDDALLQATGSAIIAIMAIRDQSCALICVELISGKQIGMIVPITQQYIIESELLRMDVAELVVSNNAFHDYSAVRYARAQNIMITAITDVPVDQDLYTQWCDTVLSEEVIDICRYSAVFTDAVSLLYRYLDRYAIDAVARMRPLQLYRPTDFLLLDSVTQRNLELVRSLHDGSVKGTLYEVLNHAATTMGARTIRSWILQPLGDHRAIERRLQCVEYFIQHPTCREQVIDLLRGIGDFERVVGRIILHRGTITDYRAVQHALLHIINVCRILSGTELQVIMQVIELHKESYASLERLLGTALACNEADYTIRSGYNEELDRLRGVRAAGEGAILLHEEQERVATGISTLKVIFHQSYGYLYEITKTHRASIPERYTIVQSLVQKERWSSAQLRQLADEIEFAQRRLRELEQALFAEVIMYIAEYHAVLRIAADSLCELDAYIGLACAAVAHQYVRPRFITSTAPLYMNIVQGRHPVVERCMREQSQGSFIANDFSVHHAERIWVITGPNMGGKSTFLRQTALISIMAQAGSFVPAQSAELPLFDRIFTRVGASDHVAGGKSTFFIEMEEVAVICAEATSRSFVILDELGRGTSTHDGRALAQSVL